jgi:glycosyltransferase involved in cell wall biosynthesis
VVLADGRASKVAAHGMPRPDRGDRSAWWAVVPVPAREAGTLELDARAPDGTRVALARVPVLEPAPPPAAGPGVGPDTIAVCLATYEPDPELLEVQLASLRGQTDTDWHCVVSDDGSSAAGRAVLDAAIGDDPRFTVSHAPVRRGFFRNFERALELVPAGVRLVALCDQDDRWHPEKLATLRAAMAGGATLAFSDLRLVERDGRVRRNTLWEGRREDHRSLTSMLVANAVTGAACMVRRDVADLARPFPDLPGLQFHDHWLALVALAAGDLAYVDRPLYDYVQHRGAVFGEVSGGVRGLRRTDGRAAYFNGYLARVVQARVLLERLGGRVSPAKRRELERFAAAERSPLALAALALRPARALAGRTETLGSEAELAAGVAWRHATALRARLHAGGDATFPDALGFEQRRLRAWRARA